MAFLVHRWLGIALAILMAVWTLSGIVMMYVAFPETTREDRLAGLQPLDLSACCEQAYLPAGVTIESATVQMLAGEPVLRWSGPQGIGVTGLARATLPGMDSSRAARIAADHFERTSGATPPVRVEAITRDQWTVYGRFRQHAPLFRASFDDNAGTVLYISGATGEVVQDTTAHERFWNWLGAVPHWLYFTALREIQPLWYNLVVYASLLGIFLTLTGIYVGIHMYGKGHRPSPYRGLSAWHHWTGLVFGVLTLSWVFSGLVSMQPWGWFESEGAGRQEERMAGRPIAPADVTALFTALAERPQPGVVAAELAVQGGQAVAILSRADGTRMRAPVPGLVTEPLDDKTLAARAAAAMPGVPLRSAGLITRPDAYHYPHHNTAVVLPVFRAIFADPQETRIYLDPRTGEMVNYVDGAKRSYRWLHYGLHRLDFAALGTRRPLWDGLMLPLLAGVAVLCLIGTWLGFRRLFRRQVRSRSGPAPRRLV